MFRKFILTFLFLLMSCAFATNVVVECLDDVWDSDIDKISVKILETSEINDRLTFEEGTVVVGEVVDVVDAKIGKRAGYIIIEPVSYEIEGKTFEIKEDYLRAKVVGYSKKDWKKLGAKAGLSAGLAAGGRFVPGLSQIFYFSKGVIKPEEGKGRFEGGLSSLYKNSPFAYLEKGQKFTAQKGDMLVLKFYGDD